MLAARRSGSDSLLEKIQPPVSAGYEGLLFPPEQSEKILMLQLLKIQVISNDFVVDCTTRFSCKLQYMAVCSQTIC